MLCGAARPAAIPRHALRRAGPAGVVGGLKDIQTEKPEDLKINWFENWKEHFHSLAFTGDFSNAQTQFLAVRRSEILASRSRWTIHEASADSRNPDLGAPQ